MIGRFTGAIPKVPQQPPMLLTDAARVAPVRQAGGNYERIVVADHDVGYDFYAKEYTEVYSVITDPNGNVVTMFPGIPQ